MNKKIINILCISFFAIFTLIIFYPFVIQHKVAINGNLLLSFYEPWNSYKLHGYSVGPPAKPIGFDSLRDFYPTRGLVTNLLKQGSIPLWNPYQFSGNVLLATFQSAVSFPLGVIFFVLPQYDAWTVIILLEPFLGALFMYLFLGFLIKDKKSRFLGSLVFGFGSLMLIAWWEEMFMAGYSVILLPLILYGVEKLFKKISIKSFLILLGACFASLSTGWFQMIFYSWIFSFCWIIYKLFNTKNKKALFYCLLSFLCAIAISSVILLPSLEAYLYSVRGLSDNFNDFNTYLRPIYHLVSYIAPDIFGNPGFYNFFGIGFYHESVLSIGIIGFVFAVFELINLTKSSSSENFFKISWIISLSLGLSLPTSWFLLYTLKIPLISTMLPSRIFFVSAFCASVLCAFGLERYFKKTEKKYLVIALLLITLMFVGAWIYPFATKKITPIDFEHARISMRNLILPSVFFLLSVISIIICFFKSEFKKVTFFIFLGVICIGTFYTTQKYLFFSPKSFVFPTVPVIEKLQQITGINRFLGVGDGYIDRNFAMYYGLYSPEGYEPFNNKRYSELVYSSHTYGKYSLNMPRNDVLIMQAPNMKDFLSNFYRRKMTSILGVKYLVEKHSYNDYSSSITDDSPLSLVWTDKVFNIYLNKEALPRFFMSYNYVVLDNNQKILNKLYDRDTDLLNTIVLETKPNLDIEKPGISNMKLISYQPTLVTFDINTTENGIFMLSDSFYPGWKVFVDGYEKKILRADYAFKAVEIPKGKHNINFVYSPASFKYGLALSGIGIFLVFIIILVLRREE